MRLRVCGVGVLCELQGNCIEVRLNAGVQTGQPRYLPRIPKTLTPSRSLCSPVGDVFGSSC